MGLSTVSRETAGAVSASATERRESRRYYRFALYGRSGSGKTCVLAKMALAAVGHPGGLTCERLPVVVPKPNGDPSSWGPGERKAAALHAGKEWIDEAVAALRRGECPPFNPPVFDRSIPLTVGFQIGSPERGPTLVRTIDYSGELIYPDEEHLPDSLTNALKGCLQEFDGLLIIADTPRDGVKKDWIDDELRLLREAFSSLRDDEQFAARTPVAVMFTKWDRHSEIDFGKPRVRARQA